MNMKTPDMTYKHEIAAHGEPAHANNLIMKYMITIISNDWRIDITRPSTALPCDLRRLRTAT